MNLNNFPLKKATIENAVFCFHSRKDKLFMAMLQSVELDFLIGIATDAIRNELMKIEADVRESALFTLRETVFTAYSFPVSVWIRKELIAISMDV